MNRQTFKPILAFRWFIAIAWLIFSCTVGVHAQSQSLSASGDNLFASECYQNSARANRSDNAEFSDLESCDQAIEYGTLLEQDLIATFVNRGLLYAIMGNLSRAERDYSSALELNSKVAEIYLNRGNLRFMSGRFEQAVSDYNKAESLELKQSHILFLNRGMAYENLGLFEQAQRDYIASLELAPDWSVAVEKLSAIKNRVLGLQ